MSISFMEGRHRIRFAGKTDVGRVRDHNEDDFLLPSEVPVAAVSDGMGGHACGEVASEIAIGTVGDHYRRTGEESPPRWPFRLTQPQVERDRMTTAIKLANARIYRAGLEDAEKKGMGCTIDAIYFKQGRVYVGHVGDSRVYRVRGGHITQVTEDHSLLNDYRRMKEMSGEELENFPHKNVVVRALGLAEYVAVDVLVDEYDLGDLYLLCSDGLCGMLSDEAILEVIEAEESLDGVCSTLVREANEAGGVDNISVVLARVEPQ
jgi:protein phosphatase